MDLASEKAILGVEQVASDLGHPFTVRLMDDSGDVHSSRTQFDDEERVVDEAHARGPASKMQLSISARVAFVLVGAFAFRGQSWRAFATPARCARLSVGVPTEITIADSGTPPCHLSEHPTGFHAQLRTPEDH